MDLIPEVTEGNSPSAKPSMMNILEECKIDSKEKD